MTTRRRRVWVGQAWPPGPEWPGPPWSWWVGRQVAPPLAARCLQVPSMTPEMPATPLARVASARTGSTVPRRRSRNAVKPVARPMPRSATPQWPPPAMSVPPPAWRPDSPPDPRPRARHRLACSAASSSAGRPPMCLARARRPPHQSRPSGHRHSPAPASRLRASPIAPSPAPDPPAPPPAPAVARVCEDPAMAVGRRTRRDSRLSEAVGRALAELAVFERQRLAQVVGVER